MFSLFSTLLLATSLSSPFGFSDEMVVNEIAYRRLKEAEHNVVWANNLIKLDKLNLVRIIDISENQSWIVDTLNGRIIKEELYLKEVRLKEIEAKKIDDIANATRLERLRNIGSSDLVITIDDDGNIVQLKNSKSEEIAIGNEKFIINFEVGKHTPIDNFDFIDQLDFSVTDKLSVTGFASPDGLNPKMQVDLAYRRMQVVKDALINRGYTVVDELGIVCPKNIERSKCWKTEIEIDK